jgi:hypothetical protein
MYIDQIPYLQQRATHCRPEHPFHDIFNKVGEIRMIIMAYCPAMSAGTNTNFPPVSVLWITSPGNNWVTGSQQSNLVSVDYTGKLRNECQ